METKTVNIYKVIPTTGISNVSFGRGMSGVAKGEQKKQVKIFATQLRAINNIGLSLNGISKTLDSIRSLKLKRLKAEEKARLKDSFEARYTETQKIKGSFKFSSGVLGRVAPDFFGGLLGFLGGLFKYLVLKPILEWLADPENQEKVISILEGIKKVVDFFSWLIKSAVVTFIDGMYDLLRDDATPWERLTGFLKAFGVIGAAFLGMNFLLRPGKTLAAFRNVFTNFNDNLKKRHNKLKNTAGKGGPAGTTGGGKKPVKVKPKTKPVKPGPFRRIIPKILKRGRSEGGIINGPMGGYPVTLDGKGVDFIGHGREFVAQKPGGDAFVIPLETPDTIKDPGLTGKRISEALKGGFDLKEMSKGGWINGPETGYLASMSGHRPDFIGHGLEYISKDSVGNSYVIPFNSSGTTLANMQMAHMAGFDLPKSLPKATGRAPGGSSVSKAAGKDGMFFGSIGKAISGAVKGIGNFFSGGSKSSGGGGGGNFISNAISGIGNLFGGGSKSSSSSSGGFGGYGSNLKTGGLDFSNAFNTGTDLGLGQDYSYSQNNTFGNFFDTSSFTPKTFSSGFNLFSGKSNYVPGVSETSGMGPLANGTQYAAMLTGNKLFGFDYNEGGGVKGGLGGILRGFSKQGGALGSLIGGLFGQKGKGNAIGNMFQTIFGGGGSNEDGSANWYDIIRGGTGIAFEFLKGKKLFGRDAQDFVNGAVNIGDLLFRNDSKTFGEKLPELLARGLHLFGKQNLLGGKLPQMLAVALGQESPLSLLPSSMQESLGAMQGSAAAMGVGNAAPAAGGEGVALDGAGPKKAKEIGRMGLTQGMTVFNHRFFKRNNWSEDGPNTRGYSPAGREAVRGQLHAQGIAMNMNNYQGDPQQQRSKLKSFAEMLYSGRSNYKLQSIVLDDWGSWFYGKKRKPPGNYGYPDLAIATAADKKTGDLGGAQSAQGAQMTDGQYQAMRKQVEASEGGPGDIFSGALSGFGSTKFMDLIKNNPFTGGTGTGGSGTPSKKSPTKPYQMPMPTLGGGIGNMFQASGSANKSAMNVGSFTAQRKAGGSGYYQNPFGASDNKPAAGGGSGGVPEHGMNDSTAQRGAMGSMEGNPLMALLGMGGQKGSNTGINFGGQEETKKRESAEIQKVTQQRQYARAQMNDRAQQTVQQTMAAVEAANAQVRASVAAAQSAIANLAAGQGARGGTLTGGGNKITQSIGGAMASIINSGLNKTGGSVFS